jgi:hypothetical protein
MARRAATRDAIDFDHWPSLENRNYPVSNNRLQV